MADMIQTGLGWLSGKLAAHAAVSCLLAPPQARSPIQALIQVRASMGQARVEMPDAGGAIAIVDTRVALIPASDLGAYRPRNGDRLTGAGVDCEVAAPHHGSASWDWADAYHTRIRVFLRERNADCPTG